MNSVGRRVLFAVLLGMSPVSFLRAQSTSPTAQRRVGRPSSAALASALDKQDAMRRPNGPASVKLSADEMASLVQAMLEPPARRALDSVGVRLAPGRLTLLGSVVTAELGTDLFGPLASMFEPREPVRVSGPARASAPGVISWEPDSFFVRNYPLPQAAIPTLVRRMTGTMDGTIPIAVPPTVLRILIDAGAVTFSRR